MNNYYQLLQQIVQKSDQDGIFNNLLHRLQLNPQDKESAWAMVKLAESQHENAKMAAALFFADVNPEESLSFLRQINDPDIEGFKSVLDLFCTVDDQGSYIRQREISKDLANYVLEMEETLTDSSVDYYDIFKDSGLAAEAFLEGRILADCEIDNLLVLFEYLKENETELLEEANT